MKQDVKYEKMQKKIRSKNILYKKKLVHFLKQYIFVYNVSTFLHKRKNSGKILQKSEKNRKNFAFFENFWNFVGPFRRSRPIEKNF